MTSLEAPVEEQETLVVLASAECPGYIWARVLDEGHLPRVFVLVRSALRHRTLTELSQREVNKVVMDAINEVEGIEPEADTSPLVLPVGAGSFPPPLDMDDESAMLQAKRLLDRSLMPPYWEGLMNLRRQIGIARLNSVVAAWEQGGLHHEEAMQKVAAILTQIGTQGQS